MTVAVGDIGAGRVDFNLWLCLDADSLFKAAATSTQSDRESNRFWSEGDGHIAVGDGDGDGDGERIGI